MYVCLVLHFQGSALALDVGGFTVRRNCPPVMLQEFGFIYGTSRVMRCILLTFYVFVDNYVRAYSISTSNRSVFFYAD